jgi:hypothetical protein
MSLLLETLPPRFFVDFTVPKRADGSALVSCREAGDYTQYVAWLADYLHQASIPLSAEQQRWISSKAMTPEKVIFECSDLFGYAIEDLDSLVTWFETEGDYAAYDAEMRRLWLENTAPEEQVEFSYEELSCATFERLRREWQQERTAGMEWLHADIPFRSLLSWALRQTPDRMQRQQQIEFFFRNYTDNASK